MIITNNNNINEIIHNHTTNWFGLDVLDAAHHALLVLLGQGLISLKYLFIGCLIHIHIYVLYMYIYIYILYIYICICVCVYTYIYI